MSGVRGAPPSEADPLLQHAFALAQDPLTFWRLRYNLPPNDPRVLEITEEELLTDLVTLMHHDESHRRAYDPTPPEADDPEVTRTYEARKREMQQSDLIKRLDRLLHGKPEGPKTMKVSVRGWGGG